MLDSERTFKITVGTLSTVLEILLTSQLFANQYLQNYKCHGFDLGYSKNLL